MYDCAYMDMMYMGMSGSIQYYTTVMCTMLYTVFMLIEHKLKNIYRILILARISGKGHHT